MSNEVMVQETMKLEFTRGIETVTSEICTIKKNRHS